MLMAEALRLSILYSASLMEFNANLDDASSEGCVRTQWNFKLDDD